MGINIIRYLTAVADCRKDTEASFNTGISACEKGGAWRDALLLLQMMSHVQMQLISIMKHETRMKWTDKRRINLCVCAGLAHFGDTPETPRQGA